MYTVFRVEHKKLGKGPYKCMNDNVPCLYHFYGRRDFHLDEDHPIGMEDLPWEEGYKFGFQTKEQLKNWFNLEELKFLFKNGYRIKRYKVPEIIVGKSGKQCIFKK